MCSLYRSSYALTKYIYAIAHRNNTMYICNLMKIVMFSTNYEPNFGLSSAS